MESFLFYVDMRERLTIQEWDSQERPREKFLEKGAGTLSNAELLAILIRTGNKNENAIELSRKILFKAGNSLKGLGKLTVEELCNFKGMGTGKALPIMAAFELSKRIEQEAAPDITTIYSSKSAAATMIPLLKDLQHEECWVIYLNTANGIIAKERITSGGINCTIVDIKMIIKRAVNKLASSIILVHNHPSGRCYPGEHDKEQTRRLKKAANTCDIELLDHIIIGGCNYYSFLDEGLL